MSEIKRAPLIPLGAQKECDKPSTRKTIRIQVSLPESTEDTCPEFNYKDELAAAIKKTELQSSGPGTVPNGVNGLDVVEEDADNDNDDDDDVRRIARQMEEKYGTGTSLNKKRKGRKDDYADIGAGYDESDSFIDNTDGYDEMIPHNVTTIHGGFYINSGALEFKADDEVNSDFSSSSSDDDDDDDEDNAKKPNSRKRIIESSDETDRENKTESVGPHVEKKRKLQNGGSGMQSMKKKLLGQNEIYIKKRRLLDPHKKTVKQLLREKREDLNMSIPSELKSEGSTPATPIEEGAPPGGDIIKDSKDNKDKSTVTDIIESVVKASIESSPQIIEDGAKSATKAITLIASSSEGESSHDASSGITRMEVRLPENLSNDIVENISAIKAAALKVADSKTTFSDSDIKRLILSLERKCKCLGKPSKMKVYEHLSFYIKCKVEKLIQHAKNLVLEDDQKKLKGLLIELQSEVSKLMPTLLDNYEKESRKILQKKLSSGCLDLEDNKSLRMPKRRFQWNDITKRLYKEIINLKKRCLLLEGKGKESLDAFMMAFLKSEVQVLWPDGWMSINTLNKIYLTYGASQHSKTQSPLPTIKNLPQSFNNASLSITPIVGAAGTNNNKLETSNKISVPSTLSKTPVEVAKPASEIGPCSPPKKELEGRLKVKPSSELLIIKPAATINLFDDDVIDASPVTVKDEYQIIDLSEKGDNPKMAPAKLESDGDVKTEAPIHKSLNFGKHHELTITSNMFAPSAESTPNKAMNKCSSAGDDIQKVMEDLKVLQKMSSPKKSVIESSPTSSAVSVIAVNKSFAPKTQSQSSTMQRVDYNKGDFSSFQDQFQKQIFSAFNHMSNPPKNACNNNSGADRYPHIANSGVGASSGEKYYQVGLQSNTSHKRHPPTDASHPHKSWMYQNSNNNYPQSSNGHKSTPSTPQSATAPKSQQK